MQNLQVPGVYHQDILPPVTPKLLTGVPVFLGVAQSKDSQTRNIQSKMLRLWTQFEQYFGRPQGFLGHAVCGFFQTGGRLCYVVPLKNHTLAELKRGLEAIEAMDTIDLVCVPDIVSNSEETLAKQIAVLEHCDRLGDRFAILDAPDGDKNDGNNSYNIQGLQGNNGALYAPWLKIENVEGYIPPCGHIAGVYARSDQDVGVHRAPANFLLEGVLDLSHNFTNAKLEQLNNACRARVNFIRSFRGRGIRVYGARTISQIPEWQHINVRRLFLTFGRWVERNLASAVFEPNGFGLWVSLERELTIYCESLWQQGALQGEKPQEAFYVKCDAQTNTPEVRNAGKVVTEIGLAPTLPSEFIVFSLIHDRSGVTLN